MTWQNILKRVIKTHEDYKMYFSFFDGETLPFGSVVEYTGSRKITLPSNMRVFNELTKGNRYKLLGARYDTLIGDYVLTAEQLTLAGGRFVALPRRTMVEEGRNFKVISRGSEQQGNISVPRKK